MNCVNRNSPEFKELAKVANMNEIVLAAKVSIWQEQNGLDKFPSVEDLKKPQEVNYQNIQTNSNEGIIASEKTIRDLAARMSDRIGIPVRFVSDRSKNYKGKIKYNIAYINLAYATLDTPVHEILGHPIIRAIKNKISFKEEVYETDLGKESILVEQQSQLYQNLLKELEYGVGKEVFDRIKRDYDKKHNLIENYVTYEGYTYIIKDNKVYNKNTNDIVFNSLEDYANFLNKEEETNKFKVTKYTLEEQQEEAIVELLGLMTAEKLDNVKDGKLISLLKRLLKEMKQFIRSLINQKEVEIDKLPDNMTIGDLADLLAYSNSKLILPGNEVIYTTPDNQQFKTYAEASKHISDLAKNVEDVDLSDINLNEPINSISQIDKEYWRDTVSDKWNSRVFIKRIDGSFYVSGHTYEDFTQKQIEEIKNEKEGISAKPDFVIKSFNTLFRNNSLKDFIGKNEEYEQSKEIIEEWKKVNNIQYNPEEIYSRGQEFSSVVGAYSDFDVNLMMQNLLSHIEDNEKAGGKFAISAFTKPIDKQIGHLEGGGGKIKFKIYPQSQDILWAANTDVYSGSVWDASEKVNKDKKSELLGVSYTKYPSLRNVSTVQPNLASIVDNLAHHHNELGIVLTGNNFRLEYDEDIPYTTKKIIDGINKILDQKYGKLVEPKFEVSDKIAYEVRDIDDSDPIDGVKNWKFDSKKDAQEFIDSMPESQQRWFKIFDIKKGIQPTQTNETLKESIYSIYNKVVPEQTSDLTQNKYEVRVNVEFKPGAKVTVKGFEGEYIVNELSDTKVNDTLEPDHFYTLYPVNEFDPETNPNGQHPLFDVPHNLIKLLKQKEYTSQALINTKIAALKEVAKKYPRSLIRSEVKPVSQAKQPLNYFEDDSLFQKISSEVKQGVEELFEENPELADIGTVEQYSQYLDTIFPDSQVKDIVYHGTDNDSEKLKKEGFSKKYIFVNDEQGELGSGFYFSPDFRYVDELYNVNGIIYAIINVQNPFNKKDSFEKLKDKGLKTRMVNVGMIEDKFIESPIWSTLPKEFDSINYEQQIVVFEPEQIHILGSKQDVEGFKQFLGKKDSLQENPATKIYTSINKKC